MSSAVLMVGTLISRFMGFFREMAMAAIFGTTTATDTWLMASIVPNLLFSGLNAALSNVVVPILSGRHKTQPNDETIFVQEIFTIIVLLATVIIIGSELLAPDIVHALAPGFDGAKTSQTVTMTRIMVPTIIFWAVAGLATGVLQARNIYSPTAAAPILMNVVRITTILTLGWFWGILGVSIGFTLAVASQWLYLIPALRRAEVLLSVRWSFSHPWTRQALSLSLPFMYSSSVTSIGVLVDRILASSLPTGSISALNYSLIVSQLPVNLLVNAYVLPKFTQFSTQWNVDRNLNMSLIVRGLNVTTALIMPFAAMMIVDPHAILRVVYQHGAFTEAATTETAYLLIFWSLGLPAAAWTAFLSRAMYARQESRVFLWLSTITIASNIVGDFILVHPMGAAGLALATSGAGWVRAALILLYLRIPCTGNRIHFLVATVKHAVASTVLIGAAAALSCFLGANRLINQWEVALTLSLVCLVSVVLYLYVLQIFRVVTVPMNLSSSDHT
nr:murein biosynthesis integral membrane protein MurJ [Sulfobacillus harzensis]